MFKPLPDGLIIQKSPIQGQGLFTNKFIEGNIDLGCGCGEIRISVCGTCGESCTITVGPNVDDDFAEQLTKWADIIRKTYQDGGIDEIISTRRLVHIVKAHSIFNDKMSAIKLCISRFDEETKTSFLDVYTKVDENVDINVDSNTVDAPVPF